MLNSCSLAPEIKTSIMKQSEQVGIKKLGPWATYFSTLKGFVAIGILYMPKNCLNGGWLVSLAAMIISFFITYYSVIKLLEAREKLPAGGSYSEITAFALGKKAKYVVDVFVFIMQLGFVIGLSYFAMKSLKSVVEDFREEKDFNIIWVGKQYDSLIPFSTWNICSNRPNMLGEKN